MVIVSHRCWAFYESQHAPSVDDVVEVIIACMACAAESVMVECIVSHLASRALQDAPLHQITSSSDSTVSGWTVCQNGTYRLM
jgi:hypothetical protein